MQSIADKVYAGQRLSYEDGLALFECNDIFLLGKLADHVRRKKNGTQVFYNVNRHINYSNVCTLSCSFCAFHRKHGEEGAYEYSVAEILEKAAEAHAAGATELHMVGGLHPTFPFQYYLDFLSALKKHYPNLHLKCFTAIEIIHLSRMSGLSIRETLAALKQAGLDSLPGGGAEIFAEAVRKKIAPEKESADEWLEVHRIAHSLGMRSNATMLYGMVESPADRIDHMLRLRTLQDETGGFQTFIPLVFHPKTNKEGVDGVWSTGLNDLKTYAISRLMLDNFQHIKAYWATLGLKMSQLVLKFGVDDLDGTIVEEKIYHMAGSDVPQDLPVSKIQKMIVEAGFVPQERDTLYNPVQREFALA